MDQHLCTGVAGVWAVGDIRGGPMFTHTAWDDYRIVESQLIGDKSRTTARIVPYAVFTDPPLARVGMDEADVAGLEPDVTERVLEIPALAELRKACAERLRSEQVTGSVRADIDPVVVANGVVAIVLSLLMSVVQVGGNAAATYADDVAAVFAAALDPPAT